MFLDVVDVLSSLCKGFVFDGSYNEFDILAQEFEDSGDPDKHYEELLALAKEGASKGKVRGLSCRQIRYGIHISEQLVMFSFKILPARACIYLLSA